MTTRVNGGYNDEVGWLKLQGEVHGNDGFFGDECGCKV